MAAGSTTKRSIKAQKQARSQAARKGWETRRAKARELELAARKRSKAAKKAAATRARNRAEKERLRAERSLRSKRAYATRKAKALVAERLERMKDLVDRASRMRGELAPGQAESLIGPARDAYHAAKVDLWDAVDFDFFEYSDVLDDIASDLDIEWDIAYAPVGD